MTEIVARSIDPAKTRAPPSASNGQHVKGLRMAAICIVLLLINAVSQIDRILRFILAEKIKAALSTDTQMGLLTCLASAVCSTVLSLRLAVRRIGDLPGSSCLAAQQAGRGR